MSLSVCSLALNEEAMLPGLLSSVASVADEVVMAIDDRTADATWHIARSAGATIVRYTWGDDFAYARNQAIEGARCDWLLTLDADERLTPDGAAMVREILAVAPREPTAEAVTGIRFLMAELDMAGRVEGIMPTSIRLFRRRPEIRYIRRCHEEPVWLPDLSRTCAASVEGEAAITHYGHCAEVWETREKRFRNSRLLLMHLAEYPDDAYARLKLEQTLALPA